MLFVHEFNFEVGDKEKHNISFYYSKWTGKVLIKSDEIEVARTHIVINPQSPIINVNVGNTEKHDLRFDIKPNWFFFSKPTINTFVDNKLVKTY